MAINKYSPTTVEVSNRSIANCGSYSTNSDDGKHILENEANAKLITAAPDMFEALEKSNKILNQVITLILSTNSLAHTSFIDPSYINYLNLLS